MELLAHLDGNLLTDYHHPSSPQTGAPKTHGICCLLFIYFVFVVFLGKNVGDAGTKEPGIHSKTSHSPVSGALTVYLCVTDAPSLVFVYFCFLVSSS